MAEDRYYRRGHWVRKSAPKAKGFGWKGWAVAVVVAYFALHSCLGSSSASTTSSTTTPTPSASASAHR